MLNDYKYEMVPSFKTQYSIIPIFHFSIAGKSKTQQEFAEFALKCRNLEIYFNENF